MQVFKTSLFFALLTITTFQLFGNTSGACPTTILVNNSGCFLYTLSTDIAEDNANYTWTIGSSTFTTPTVNFSVAFPSVYNVTLTYTSASCPSEITLTTVLNYQDCGAVCPASITSQEIDCNVFELSFFNVSAGMQATWTINNENFTGTEIVYTLPAPGTYLATAVVTNPNCPNAINLSKTLTWTDCATACPDSIVATNLGCNVYEITSNILEEGAVSEWSVNGTFLSGDTVYYSLPDNNNATIALSYTSAHCTFGTELTLELVNEICATGCPENIIVTPLSCNTYLLSLNTSQPESITWNIEGVTYAGNNIGYVLNQEGTINVAAYYNGTDCNSGTSISTTLTYENCTDVCPAEIILAEHLCNDYHFTIDADYPEEGAIWTVNGDTLNTTFDFYYTLPTPGSYIVTVTYLAPDCPLGTTLSATYEYVECNNVCPTAIVAANTDCNEYVLTLNNIAPSETAIWSINGQALPAINAVTINIAEAGSTNVSVYYVGTECTSGVSLDTTLVWNICGDGSCQATFTYVQGNNGEVVFTNTSTYEGTAEYLWDFADASVSTAESPMVQYVVNGVYNVCLTITTPTCTDTYCTEVSVESVFECADTEVSLVLTTNNTTNTNQVGSYSIKDENNNIISTIEVLMPTGISTNTQSVCLPDGCYSFQINESLDIADVTLQINNITNSTTIANISWLQNQLDTIIYFGINADCPNYVLEKADQNALIIYPNPANNNVQLSIATADANGRIKIYDTTGKMVGQEKMNAVTMQLSLNTLPAGMYTLVYETDTYTASKRLVVQH
jgi:hypothetical protein